MSQLNEKNQHLKKSYYSSSRFLVDSIISFSRHTFGSVGNPECERYLVYRRHSCQSITLYVIYDFIYKSWTKSGLYLQVVPEESFDPYKREYCGDKQAT
ncbi:hypothetical protein NQ318_010105 [Aromia moschata]|uniref:Uncharacterized protein n=1 Tax=Aromia moschata TaxID=1265417 RepID=A0AAV8Y8S5_9CUCU|nr:hypothetical protein NQ318_010105 [Aromia moschata]